MNKHFSLKWYEQIVGAHNPFGFTRMDKGQSLPLSFPTFKDAYFYALEALFMLSPRGYIDISLFIENNTPLHIRDAERFVKTLKTMGIDNEIYLMEGWTPCDSRNEFLQRLLTALHCVTGTSFSKPYFDEALRQFDEQYKEYINKKANLY